MRDNTKTSEFRETQKRSFDSPHLRTRHGHAEKISPLSFPARRTGKTFETPLPRSIELDEKVGGNVPRNIGEPEQFRTKLFQAVDLIKSGRVTLSRHRHPEQAMFVRKIPEPAQRAIPRLKPRLLRWRRIDAVTEGFVRQHVVSSDCPLSAGRAPGRDEATRGQFIL